MENLYKQIQKNSLFLFMGGLLLVGFFIIAVKISVSVSATMIGKPLPAIEKSQWINRTGDTDDGVGKITLLFFWRPGIKISEEMLVWGVRWHRKFRTAGLRVIGVASPSKDEPLTRGKLKKILREKGITYKVALDETGDYRRKMLHRSFATYYITDRQSVIKVVSSGIKGMETAEKEILGLL